MLPTLEQFARHFNLAWFVFVLNFCLKLDIYYCISYMLLLSW